MAKLDLKGSPALQYQIELTEDTNKDGSVLSSERTRKVFLILKEVIPQMGVYRSLFQLLYDELHKSVYSKEISTTDDNSGSITNIPYFSLYNNILRSRHSKAEELESKIQSLQDTISEKNEVIEEAEQDIAALKKALAEMTSERTQLAQEVVDLTNTISRLDSSFKEFVAQKEISDGHYEEEIENLQHDLDEKSGECDHLQAYEKLYTDLNSAFIKPEIQVKKQKPAIVPASNKNSVLVDLKTAQTLEKQLVAAQNALVEEFDVYMEKYKAELANVTLARSFREDNFDRDEKMLQRIDNDLAEKQELFKRNIADIHEELEHLSIHKESLEFNRDRIKVEEEEKTKDMKIKSKEEKEAFDALSVAEKEALDTVFDKLDAQEQLVSKYASIVYFTRNWGKTFYELPQNKFCKSCGAKTLICPHKASTRDWVIDLPPNTHMLRISRPKLKMVKKLDDDEIEALFAKQVKAAAAAEPSEPDQEEESPPQEELTEEASPEASPRSSAQTPAPEVSVPDALYFARIKDIELGMQPITDKLDAQFEILWKEFRSRTGGFLRSTPRHLSQDRVLSLVEQLLSAMLWKDRSSDPNNVPSFNDNLYAMFLERFLVKEIAYATVFDFLNSLHHFARKNLLLLMVVHCLVGELDAAYLRYVITLGDVISTCSWTSIEDLHVFLSAAYHFLPEDERDNLVLDYVSFSKNCINAELVLNFFLYIKLKTKGPRYNHSEIQLCQFPSAEPGFMSAEEFGVAVSKIVPLHSGPLRQRLYLEALAHPTQQAHGKNSVSFETLVQITAYLELLEVVDAAKSVLLDPSQSKSQYTQGELRIRAVPQQRELLTSSRLMRMASNFAQRERVRMMRKMQASLDKAHQK